MDAEEAARLIATAADVVLVLDEQGRILDNAFSGDEAIGADWRGKQWVDVVTIESRPKVEAMLSSPSDSHVAPRWRQVNHPVHRAPDVPVDYCAIRIDGDGRIIAIGRNLRTLASLQQRVIEVQQSLERDYWQLRQTEARFRLLFQTALEPVLVLDAANRKIIEANPSADKLLTRRNRELVGQSFPDGFNPAGQEAITSLLDGVCNTGRSDSVIAHRADGTAFSVSAALLRQQLDALLIVRLVPQTAGSAMLGAELPETKLRLLQLMEKAPDAVVVTDAQGAILSANRMFLDLAQMPSEEVVRRESLGRWLGRHGVDLDVLLASLRQHAVIRLFPTTLRGELGSSAKVEVSAVSSAGKDTNASYGFFVRHVDHRPTGESEPEMDQPRSMEQMTQLVGQVPLKELVRESTDLIEKLCIEAALQLTGDNRASAAELLGLSRQSLYVKLRRHGLMDGDSGEL
nr:transcriptional regulator PpsR [Natronocella acetinitrilica]